jgi:cytochrome c oxidase subunit 2
MMSTVDEKAMAMKTCITTRNARLLGQALLLLAALQSTACSVAGSHAPTPPAQELFQLCQQCHGEQAEGKMSVNAPTIAGMPQWYIEAQLKKFKEGGRGTHFDDLSGMQMRPMAMSLATDDEIAAISKFVSALPAHKPAPAITGGDAEKGKQLFTPCIACHGAEAAGNEAVKAPPLTGANDWYLVSSLKKFKDGVRGTNPLDVSGGTMRPMAQTLPDEQAVKDVVAYIMSLRK